jgi:DUF1365 family protein
MTSVRSALYVGAVKHHRLRPRDHRLRYSMFYMLLDLDELETLDGNLRLFSLDRFNLFSFYGRDHGDGSSVPLKQQIETLAAQAGIETGGSIRVLTLPRVLGYVFNPISVYFCHRADGTLSATLYEVNSTFGERHTYLLAVEEGEGDCIRQQGRKALYVSPFMSVAMRYDFRVTKPGDRIVVAVIGLDERGPLILSNLVGKRRALSDAALLRVFFTHPLVTLKVIAGIHFEALRLWWKGVALVPRPSHDLTTRAVETADASAGKSRAI